MHNHFDQYLDVKSLILENRPQVIVECGVARGENTWQILSLLKIYQFTLYSINDCPFADDVVGFHKEDYNGNFNWMYDLSYRAISGFPNDYIDFCLIDTDHNYWTMDQELNALHPKLKYGGIVVMHDTQTYRKNSGQMGHYGTGDKYPEGIDLREKEGLGMGDAIFDFLKKHQCYIVLRQVLESHGAMALKKVNA